jgi:hypothetical protein
MTAIARTPGGDNCTVRCARLCWSCDGCSKEIPPTWHYVDVRGSSADWEVHARYCWDCAADRWPSFFGVRVPPNLTLRLKAFLKMSSKSMREIMAVAMEAHLDRLGVPTDPTALRQLIAASDSTEPKEDVSP